MPASTDSSALSRSRSLRTTSTKLDAAATRDHLRHQRPVSPTRLPTPAPVGSTATTKSRTGATTTATTRSSRSHTTSSAATNNAPTSRPLSGVFSRISTVSTTSLRNAAKETKESSSAADTSASAPQRPTRTPSARIPSSSSSSTRAPTTSGTASSVSAADKTRSSTSSSVPSSRRGISGAITTTSSRIPGTDTASSSSASAASKARHARAKSSGAALTPTTSMRPSSRASTTSSGTTATTTTTATVRSRPPLSSHNRPRPVSSATVSPIPGSPAPTTTAAHRRIPSTTIPGSPRPSAQPRDRDRDRDRDVTTSSISNPIKLKPPSTPRPSTTSSTASPFKPPPPQTSPSKGSATTASSSASISADITRLQTELLHLHLLHSTSIPTRLQWEDSARSVLESKFRSVAALNRQVEEEEAAVVEARGIWAIYQAFGSLGRGGGEGGMDERVAMLDDVLSGLWAMIGFEAVSNGSNGARNDGGVSASGLGGRYGWLVATFERWLAKVEAVLIRRRELDLTRPTAASVKYNDDDDEEEGGGGGGLFTPPLPPNWHDESASLQRRLNDWSRKLDELGEVPDLPPHLAPPSSSSHHQDAQHHAPPLQRVLAACRTLVKNMLAELDEMDKVQKAVGEDERRWVSDVNRALAREEERGFAGGRRSERGAGAIWRGF
ncbi:hypothetical protein VTJ04DRAFT_485 [Mycothermus thermophilus]|uniref:uncharacterized protein n=1 Tax=Humicola insolens TaxID=85995 RepID=UPI0037433499